MVSTRIIQKQIEAKLIEYVPSMDDLRASIRLGSANSFGTGGMNTKLEAADKLTSYGIPMILANGSHEKSWKNLQTVAKKRHFFVQNKLGLQKQLEIADTISKASFFYLRGRIQKNLRKT